MGRPGAPSSVATNNDRHSPHACAEVLAIAELYVRFPSLSWGVAKWLAVLMSDNDVYLDALKKMSKVQAQA